MIAFFLVKSGLAPFDKTHFQLEKWGKARLDCARVIAIVKGGHYGIR